MDSYTDFAYLYDTFMEDVPYDEWGEFFDSLLKAYGDGVVKSVLDLGCGTGKMTRILASYGYEMMGVDSSEDMLSVARGIDEEDDSSILYINQDMRELELLDKQDAIISCCDCVNYLILDEDMESAFNSVHSALKDNGLFIFDFNTVYKYETVIGDTTIAESREDCSFIWENYYSKEDHINEYDITFFSKIDGEDELFRRFEETHIQRGYTLSEMEKFAKNAGFKVVVSLDENTHKKPTSKSERIYLILRK
ncbi:MAG: class I SAM-dependent methyltransferase [Lachnospiraceae bacterium]|nr:class I SAM-dependent methyltransferase [Lachnospiraceae bacterium]